MKHVNVNIVNMEQTEKLAKEAYNEAKEMNDQAGELADMMGNSNMMMTIVMICVGVLLAVAVFGNLYAQINNPPPPAYYPPPRKSKVLNILEDLGGLGSFVEDKELVEKYGKLDDGLEMKGKKKFVMKKFFTLNQFE